MMIMCALLFHPPPGSEIGVDYMRCFPGELPVCVRQLLCRDKVSMISLCAHAVRYDGQGKVVYPEIIA